MPICKNYSTYGHINLLISRKQFHLGFENIVLENTQVSLQRIAVPSVSSKGNACIWPNPSSMGPVENAEAGCVFVS